MPLTALKPVADVRDRLRDATLSAHQRLDGLLASGLADIRTYHGYVRGMHRFIGDAEVVLDEPPLRSLWLARDLVALEQAPLPPRGVLRRVTDADERLGWQYVIAGSSMGARVLVRDARRLGLTAGRGATFLDRHAIDGEWPGVVRQLQALDPTGTREALLARGAHDAFAAAEACLRRALFMDELP
ncbi:biliverdin-producing heme oxygenase [Luteimonas yindakuii]|uniref:biliverdin-producing heme oxygenase n=1 Tax=Luteimonas yindakuii TaxID=2565782 RepID=UPI00140CF511|nr:biliverdin-producing heme oxygenase [Luteimonas yindakuii]